MTIGTVRSKDKDLFGEKRLFLLIYFIFILLSFFHFNSIYTQSSEDEAREPKEPYKAYENDHL